jgi:di/tricarboxylate transporter
VNGLDWQAWFTLSVVIAIVVALVREWARTEIVLLSALGALLLVGIISVGQAFSGFANPAVLAVGALFVVASGLQRTGALRIFDVALSARTRSTARIVPQMMAAVAALSAFLNNTTVVAMLAPRVQQWAEQNKVPASKLLIPLSYAAIVGGMTTLIGTSTNIVVSGLLEAGGYEGLGMFSLTWIGVPIIVVVVLYFALIGHRLLPDHSQDNTPFNDGLTDCLFELKVTPGSPLVGRTTSESGMRALGDAYLAHIRRSGHLVPATPHEVLQPADVLTFAGSAAALDRLLLMPGLERTVPGFEQHKDYETLPLFEAVVAPTSKLVGRTLKDASFRENYHGVVLGIQRKDARITESLGRIPIEPGDLLLIEAWNGFDKRWNASREEFYLVAPRRGEVEKVLTSKAPVALLIMLAMIVSAGTGLVELATAAIVAALAMIFTGCVRGREAPEAVDGPLLIAIASSFGVAAAVESTGLAAAIANLMTGPAAALGPLAVIAGIYLATTILTEFLTNNAAAVLMLPIALAAANDIGVSTEPFAIAVAVAASAGFIIPFGYQTHLMVMAAGGYRFSDFSRAGFPVSVLCFVVTMAMIYFVWM